MATESTHVSTTSTVACRSDAGFRPIDWWADFDDGAVQVEPRRRTAPIPAFVRLSRLIDPDKVSARAMESNVGIDPAVAADAPTLLGSDPKLATRRRWADSAGRPLFRIGLAAIVAALVVGVTMFRRADDGLTSVESPEATIVVGPGLDGGNDAGTAGNDEQARQVLEALVHQASTGGEADLSIVGTASAIANEVSWTATVRNAGPETAEGPVTVVQTIGSDFELISVAGSGWDCLHLRAAGTISCELDEDLGTGQRRRLGLVTSIAGVEPGTRIASTMSVVAGTTDLHLDDNTINVAAMSAPTDDDRADSRSRSTGAAGQSDTSADTNVGATSGPSDDQTGTAGMEELPRTGSGLVVALGVTGVGLCLAGRRLMTWSARAQTRTLLRVIDIV